MTPAGGSMVNTVGMNVGSRGLSDWTCRLLSGSVAWTATRIVDPGCAPLASTIGVKVARGRRSCASAVDGWASTTATAATAVHAKAADRRRRSEPMLIAGILLERNRGEW